MTGNEALTARAALWAWAARAFTYPTPELEQAFREPAERGRLAELARIAGPDGAVTRALGAIWAALDASGDPDEGGEDHPTQESVRSGEHVVTGSGHVSLAEEYTFLFGRHVRVPPYESSYILERGTDRSTHLAEMGGLCAAFGLTVSPAHPEMPDHLGAECELLAVLLAKEAYATARGWSSRTKLSRRARRKLVTEHLQRWLPAFAERLEKHHRRPLYPALTGLLLQLLAVEERLLGATRPPGGDLSSAWPAPTNEPPTAEDESSALTCEPSVLERERTMMAGAGSVSP